MYIRIEVGIGCVLIAIVLIQCSDDQFHVRPCALLQRIEQKNLPWPHFQKNDIADLAAYLSGPASGGSGVKHVTVYVATDADEKVLRQVVEQGQRVSSGAVEELLEVRV